MLTPALDTEVIPCLYDNLFVSLQCATANPDGQKRALLIGGGIANFTDVAATFSGIIRALREKVSQSSYSFGKLYHDNLLVVKLNDC